MAAASTQLAVLGAGPGGYAAAFYAADLGMQVTLIDEEQNPGGVCLYRGCIPSKALLHVAKVIDEARHAVAWGVTFGEPTIDLGKLRAFKQGVVDKLTGGVGQVAKLRKVTFLQGRATLTGPRSMTIAGAGGNTDLQFEHCVLATGSSPTRKHQGLANDPVEIGRRELGRRQPRELRKFIDEIFKLDDLLNDRAGALIQNSAIAFQH
jgi:dihydrolipoamide dehydrogenase